MPPRLPSNLVKAPVFDNPMRPTSVAVMPLVPSGASEEGRALERPAPAESHAEDLERSGTQKEDDEALIHRMSVRFTDDQWKALQTASYQRRMRGERMNIAELLRELVDEWMGRSGDADFDSSRPCAS